MTDDGRWLVGGALLGLLGVAAAVEAVGGASTMKRVFYGSRTGGDEEGPTYASGYGDPSRQGDLFFGFDRPDFTHYVLLEGRILSAWPSLEEAKDYVTQDLPALGGISEAVIASRKDLRRIGLDPARTSDWWG